MIFGDGEAWWEELVKKNMMEDIKRNTLLKLSTKFYRV
jgi:hypothetical protein